jgi:hypothetical protein
MAPPRSKHNWSHSRRRRRRRRSLHQVDNLLTPLSSTMRRWRSSSRASVKSSSKGVGRTTKPAPRKFATSVVSPIILLQNVHYLVTVTGATTRRARGEKRYHKKRGGDAHVCREWDSDESSTDSSSDEDAANIAVTKGLLCNTRNLGV